MGQGLVVLGAVGQKEHEIVGDDERHQHQREESDQPSQGRHVADYTSLGHFRLWVEIKPVSATDNGGQPDRNDDQRA